ncbi:MAG: 30S ribosomal protein S20 [Atribacterota bacterium]|jgi:small subunit ribosomal protein S20|nr:30S ribosomal protein S20 [Atribacterota bacterium]MDY0382647.1 30S ribosomal protein S20 [Atribacterota bacterium]
MPIIKSAIKRVKISEKQLKRNSAYKSRVKTFIKKFENSLNTEDKDAIEQHYRQCVSVLDKAAQKGILAKNTVSRKKSLLAKKFKLHSLNAQSEAAQNPEKK